MSKEQGMSIFELLRMPLSERRTQFDVTAENRRIDRVIIDSNVFTNYGTFSFAWKKSYIQEPERSESGTIEELDSYATFITPYLTINFGIMTISDYRRFAQLYKSRNEFTVTCYDVENDRLTTNRMYFSPNELPKLRMITHALSGQEAWTELVGVEDLTIEMIGTNVGIDEIKITYDFNFPADYYWHGLTTKDSEPFAKNQSHYVGDEALVLVGGSYKKISSIVPDGKYKFKYWQDEQGFNYVDGNSYIFNEPTTLKAIWEASAK